jgi:hypothetical protein
MGDLNGVPCFFLFFSLLFCERLAHSSGSSLSLPSFFSAAHEVVATVAIFAPTSTIRMGVRSDDEAAQVRHLIVSAGYNGELKFVENRGKPKAI